ncbi:hypothetical protein A2U01_0079459, partial [Trifolium medium]|nr:hypothetical protein [Trifolium medium]
EPIQASEVLALQRFWLQRMEDFRGWKASEA